MSIPLLEYAPTTQNQRVDGYEIPNEDTPTIYRLANATSSEDIDAVIWASYRQIFSEHLILASYRQTGLESQLRNRAINVREFIRGLGKSEVFRSQIVDTNSNYRLVNISLQRFLGRSSYSKDEEIAWSIVISTQGYHGFVDALVDSDEYLQNFGDDIVPFQRRRFGDRPFNLVNPRYNQYWRDVQAMRQYSGRSFYNVRTSGELTTADIRRAIPANFFAMAGKIITNEQNYQRSLATAQSYVSSVAIPDTSRDNQQQPTVKPVPVSLPYRYIPGTQTN